MDRKMIGLRIKEKRKIMRLTQEQLAERIDISTIHISHIEAGTASMSLDSLLAICDALNTTPNSILIDEFEMPRKELSAQLSDALDKLTRDEINLLLEITGLLHKFKINR